MTRQETDTVIGSSSRISIALLGGIFTVLTATSWGASRWAASMEHSIDDMAVQIVSVKATLDKAVGERWTVHDMAVWTERLRELNPELRTPAVAK